MPLISAAPIIHDKYIVCFTPGSNCTNVIIQQLKQAKTTIHIQAYSFTAWPIAHALAKAHTRGVNVNVLVDKSQQRQNSHSVAPWLQQKGISIWVDYKPAIAHNKVIIIDRQTVITGSFNFSGAAQYRNAENLLVIQDKALAQYYLTNWQQRQQQSEIFKPFTQPSWLDQLWHWLKKQFYYQFKHALKQLPNI